MKVSIITVCKNSEKTIAKTIQAIFDQTYPNIEYLVIDGDSQDGTKEIIQQYRDRIAVFLSEPDNGIYQAMNRGITQASGDFLYFANADDYLFDASVIQDLVDFVLAHPDCNLVYGNHEARFASGDRAIYQPVLPEKMLEEMVCLGDDHFHQPTSFFRANLFQQVGLFNETYKIASDYEWFLRFLQDPTFKFCYLPRTIVSYAHGGASANIVQLFTEVFDIQNQNPLCSEPEWLIKRLNKLQTMFVEKYDLLERTNTLSLARLRHIEGAEDRIKTLERQLVQSQDKSQTDAQIAKLQQENGDLQARIAAMETSKFWQLRSVWFQLKQKLGLPVDRE